MKKRKRTTRYKVLRDVRTGKPLRITVSDTVELRQKSANVRRLGGEASARISKALLPTFVS